MYMIIFGIVLSSHHPPSPPPLPPPLPLPLPLPLPPPPLPPQCPSSRQPQEWASTGKLSGEGSTAWVINTPPSILTHSLALENPPSLPPSFPSFFSSLL